MEIDMETAGRTYLIVNCQRKFSTTAVSIDTKLVVKKKQGFVVSDEASKQQEQTVVIPRI